MDKVMYCERCGWVGYVLFKKKCKYCNTKMRLLSEEIKEKYNIFDDSWSEILVKINSYHDTIDEELALREELNSRTNNFIQNELANSQIFSIEAYNIQMGKRCNTDKVLAEFHQKQIIEQQNKINQETQKILDKQNCVPKCPICSSTNIKKITMTTRAVKTATFGIAGAVDDAGKTYKCNNCGSKF